MKTIIKNLLSGSFLLHNELRCIIRSIFLIIFGFDAMSNSLLLNEKTLKVSSTPLMRCKNDYYYVLH